MRTLSRREFVAGLAGAGVALAGGLPWRVSSQASDLILHNGRIATLSRGRPFVEAVAIRDGRFVAVGTSAEVVATKSPGTKIIDLGGRTAIPGLNDSHIHVIRGGLNY